MSDGLLGVIIGGVLVTISSIIVELLRTRRDTALDKQKREDDRRIGRDVFQRETLLALQDAVHDLTNASLGIYAERRRAFREKGSWPETWSAELDAAGSASLLAVKALQSRIADDEVRRLAHEVAQASREVLTASDEATGEAAGGMLGSSANKVIDRCGELIRSSFLGD